MKWIKQYSDAIMDLYNMKSWLSGKEGPDQIIRDTDEDFEDNFKAVISSFGAEKSVLFFF